MLHLGTNRGGHGSQCGSGSSPRSGARPCGLPRGSDECPASGIEIAAGPGDHLLRRTDSDRRARGMAAGATLRSRTIAAGLCTALDTMPAPLIAATASMPRSPNWPPTVPTRRWSTRLGCLRGVSTSTAFGVAVEIGDWGQQPAPAPPLRVLRYPQEAPRGRQHRRRPGTGRLALVAGPARHLSTGPYSNCPNNPGGGGSAWE